MNDSPRQHPPDRSVFAPARVSRSERNFYGFSGLDRAADLRKDADWLGRRLTGEECWLVPIWRSRNYVHPGEPPDVPPEAVFLPAASAGDLLARSETTVFLGLRGEAAYVAIDISTLDEVARDRAVSAVSGKDGAEFLDLRFVGPQLHHDDGGVLAYARAMLTWHRRHLFCGACGSPTAISEAGHVRQCTDESCGMSHFPRTDPAVIMLVTDGDRCLLGRHSRFPEGMHSTLAGFVEPGEPLETAVAREIAEEAGIRVDRVRYHSSQPWPFPTSLMLGFYADAVTTELAVNTEELESAAWYEKAWIEEQVRNRSETFRLPRRDSIARRLIDDWLNGEAL